MNEWIANLFEQEEMLRMGHSQRREDLNLGLGWLYYGLARLIRPQTIVVIGSWRGYTPILFGKALAENVEGGVVIFIDPSLVDDFWKDEHAKRAHFATFGLTNVRHFLMTTQQFVTSDAYRSLAEVGIVMIDGYHTEQQARFDFQSFQGLVPPTGMILLHDSCRQDTVNIYGAERAYQRSVKLFVDELKTQPQFQVLDLPYSSGLTLVRKVHP